MGPCASAGWSGATGQRGSRTELAAEQNRGVPARGGRKGKEETALARVAGSSARGGCDARAALLGCGAGEGVAALGELGLGGLLGGGVEGVRRAAVGSGPRGEGRLGPPGRGKGMRRRAGWVLVSSFFLLSFSISYFKQN